MTAELAQVEPGDTILRVAARMIARTKSATSP